MRPAPAVARSLRRLLGLATFGLAALPAQNPAAVGDLYITEEASGEIHRHDGVTGTRLGLLTTVAPPCQLMAIHTGETVGEVLVGSTIGGVREVDRNSGALIRIYNPLGGWQWAGVYAPNGDVLIGDMSTNDVRRYRRSDGALLGVFGTVPAPADMRFGPNGNLFVCSFAAGGVFELNGSDGSFVAQHVARVGMTNDIAFLPDGRRVVTSMADNRAHVFDANWSPLAMLAGTGWGRPHGVDISPHDGHIYVVDGVTTSVHVFHKTTYAELNASFASVDAKPVDIEFRRGRVPGVVDLYGQGCHGLTIDHVGVPRVGNAFDLTLAGARGMRIAFLQLGASRTTWNGLPLPLALDALGAPGCQVLASGELLLPVVTDAAGTASLHLNVPADPDLAGAQLFAQWLVRDPALNPLGLIASGAAALTIGD